MSVLLHIDLQSSGLVDATTSNYQRCYVQEVRTDEIYQISWLEGIVGYFALQL